MLVGIRQVTRRIFETAGEAASAMAEHAAHEIRSVLAQKTRCRLVAATGASQIEFLARLTSMAGIDWPRVELFHLDEYVGIAPDHPASFCRFIRDRILTPTGITVTHLLDGSAEVGQVIATAAKAISAAPVDLLFAGVGENGHLAFNEPPADFHTGEPFLLVNLDQRTRLQQVKEGWFSHQDEVPRQAITMSILQILKAREILCIATGERKAEAVERCFAGPVEESAPASALRMHPNATLFLDRAAAGGLV